ncbi:MAG: hypothetical protein J6R00_08615 [Lentisphaeria bacterium]|nr:hypothetical protein [Lentisphaeria bacterium]
MKVILIPGGKDPDELFKNGGAEAVRAAVESARPWNDVIIEELPEHFDFSTPVGRAGAAGYMAELLKLVDNQVELETYIRQTSEKLGVTPEAIYSELSGVRRREERKQEFARKDENAAKPVVRKRYPAALLTLLELALFSENTARFIADELEPGELPDINNVSKAINMAVNAALNGEYEQLDSQLNNFLAETPEPEISRLMVERTNWSEPEKAVHDSIIQLRKLRIENKKKKLFSALAAELDPAKRMELLSEISKLK